jgi:hypothetical protein
VLFERRLQEGLKDGSISLAFRRWQRSQVVAGRQYRSPIGMVDVTEVRVVDGPIPEADAVRAGFPSVTALERQLTGDAGASLFRIEMRLSQQADPRETLAADGALDDSGFVALEQRLKRLDRTRPWTRETLEAIAAQPGRRAGDLAEQLGWNELLEFKLRVRQLKALGLTISLQTGYRLSPRGEAYLARISVESRARSPK